MANIQPNSSAPSTSTLATMSSQPEVDEKPLHHERDLSGAEDDEEIMDPLDGLAKEIITGDVEKHAPTAQTPAPPAALDWDSPTDPENPRNWSFKQRVFQTAPPALFSLVVTFASPIYTPAISQLQKEFDVSIYVAILGVTTFTLGLALGPMIGAPISEMLGRRPVYLITFPGFLLFTMGAGLAPNMAAFSILRLLAGTVGSPSLAVGAGTIGDIWDLEKSGGLAAALFVMAPFLGSSIAPVMGGLATHHRTWRWAMWLVILVGGPLFLIFAPFMRETYKPAILKRRAKKQGLELPKGPGGSAALRRVVLITLLRPVRMLFTEPIVIAFSIYCSFTFAVLFCFFAAIPYSYETQYGFDSRESGAVFAAVAFGIVCGCATFGAIDATMYRRRYVIARAKGERVSVEARLFGAMFGSFGLPIGLFWFAWTCRTSIHWIVPTIGLFFFGWGNMLIFLSAITYNVDVYQASAAASALSANGILRYTWGACFPIFTLQMYRALSIEWATSLLGFVSLLLILVPFGLFKYGLALRMRSSYDTLKV